jgi:hypothetical protein
LRRLAPCLACLLVACGGEADDRLDVTFDPCSTAVEPAAATEAEWSGVEAAMLLWNDAAALRLAIAAEAPALRRIVVRFEDAPHAFKGVYDDERGVVFVNRKITDPHERAVTIAHELGHAFGLPHVDSAERASLMNPANTAIEPTAEDVAALRALWGNCANR